MTDWRLWQFILKCRLYGSVAIFFYIAPCWDIVLLLSDIRKYKTNSYNFARELEYSFYIHYRVNGKEKKLYFVQVSVYGILEEFEKRNIEIIWKGDGFERDK